jgi:TetR/AcrR family transcriptional regulator, transcriptional repressor for nem operon
MNVISYCGEGRFEPMLWVGHRLPYSKEHGPAVRARIIDAASKLMRERGMGVSIVDVMEDVGLTHGGFYQHFKSRQDLVEKSIVWAVRQTNERIRLWLRNAPSDEGLKAIVESYLHPSHRDEIGTGCPLPALGADIARMPLAARRDFSSELETMIGLVASQYKGRSREAAHRQATAAVATMVGAILIARATSDPLLSDGILTSGRRAVLDPAGSKTPRRSARATSANRQAGRWRQSDLDAIET